jgi:TP901 family phage tail tape measure protein
VAEVIFRIGADSSELQRALGQASSAARQSVQATNAEIRREEAKRRAEEKKAERERIAGEKRVAREATAAEKQKTRDAKRQEDERLRAAMRTRLEMKRGAEKKRADFERLEKQATEIAARELRQRVRLEEKTNAELMRLQRRLLASHQANQRQMIDTTRRNSERSLRERVQRSNGRRETLSNVAGVVGGVGAVVGGAALASFNATTDQTRQANDVRDNVELSAARIAADTGALDSRQQIIDAIRTTSTDSGLRPEDIAEALSTAQSSFSALGDADSRASYLQTVLPELARLAVATNTPLADVVSTAGELQRQLNISNTDLPDTLAKIVDAGRKGSVGFTDMAQSMGVLGGQAATFTHGGQDAVDLVNTVFQFGGRAGGTGAEAATRAQAFFGNLTTAEGQRGFNSALGSQAFDAHGQIQTNRGESQSAAFTRMIEAVYRNTGGNSVRFARAVGGGRKESIALANQLFRDLSSHDGQLTDFRQMLTGSRGTTSASVTRPAFESVSNTEAMRKARQTNRTTFREAESQNGHVAMADRAAAEARERGGWRARLMNVPGMDTMNQLLSFASDGADAEVHGTARTRADELRNQARALAASRYNTAHQGLFERMSDNIDPREREKQIEQGAQGIFNQLVSQTGQTAAELEQELTVSQESANQLAQANAQALMQTTLNVRIDPISLIHLNTLGHTGNTPPAPR